MRLSGNGDLLWLKRSEMSSGLTSEDMEAGGIEGGPGEFFLTYKANEILYKLHKIVGIFFSEFIILT